MEFRVHVWLGHVQEREEVRRFRLRLRARRLSHLIIHERSPTADLDLHLTLVRFGLDDGLECGNFTFNQENLLIRRRGRELRREALQVVLLDPFITEELFLPVISLSVMRRISTGRSLFGLDGRITRCDSFI